MEKRPVASRYRFHELLGQGSMGRVHRVTDRETGQEVALKTLHSMDAEDLLHLKREFRVLAGISHPNLVQLYDLVVEDGTSYFTMELVEGPNFLDYAGRDEARVRESLSGVAAGLGALHDAGIVHRDVKPSNVLVARDGRVVLVDFGLAGAVLSLARGSLTGGLAGTLAYMAPEIFQGEPPTPSSDWYSVGVMLFEVLTGQLPFTEADLDALLRRGESQPPWPRSLVPDTANDLDELTRALIHPDPAIRAGRETVLSTLFVAEPEELVWRPVGSTLIGRSEELRLLQESFEASCKGAPRIVAVRGDSGMGKTTLLEGFVESARDAPDALVLRSRCHPHESVPYKAMDGLIDELCRKLRRQDPSELGAIAPRHIAALCRLFPVLEKVPFPRLGAGGIHYAEPHEVRRRGGAALRELLARIADRRPLVMWIDDAQWGDADSAALLEDLLRPPDAPALLWLFSYRSEERERAVFPSRLEDFLGRLEGQSRILDLPPLDLDEIRDLVGLVGGADRDDAARVEEIARESRGLPLFAAELARSPGDRAPSAIRLDDWIGARFDRLDTDEQSLLSTLTVLGGPAELTLLGDLTGLGGDARRACAALEHARLVRASSIERDLHFEVYHDRVREAVLGRMPADLLRTRHLEIARVLSRSEQSDPEALYRHYLAGGDLGSATRHCLTAADAASRQLAFDRAAELYRKGLEIGVGFAEPGDVLPRLGECLANAGRGREAADAYAEAARGLPAGSSARRRMSRHAAGQLLTSGHLDEGVATLEPLVQELGLPFPRSPREAVLRTGVQMLRLWVRGQRFRPREEADLAARDLERVDLCDAAARGLLAVDSIRGGYFNVLAASLALRCGEPARVGRSLALLGGGALGAAGGALARWGMRMLDTAQRIGNERQEPRLRGSIHIGRCQTLLFEGRWKESLEEADRGVSLLTEQCRGVAWECNIGRMAALRSLEELGDLVELATRAEEWQRRAEQRGDLYGEVTARLNRGLGHLARGEPDAARAEAREVVERWSHEGYHVQHLYALRLELYADLYEGLPEAAWSRLEDAWPAIRKSFLLRFPLGRLDVNGMWGRTALRLAEVSSDRRSRLLATAEQHAGRLQREGRPEFRAHAAVLRAGIARLRGERDEARRLLTEAASLFDGAGMALYAACAGLLASGDDAAETRITASGVSDPRNWVELMVPGFGSG